MWSSRCHDSKNGCICNEFEIEYLVNAKCQVSGHSQMVSSVAFSPDGQRVVSGSHDKLVKMWDAATGSEVSE